MRESKLHTGSSSAGRTLTSRAAARLLGVSEASVKRWADAGALASARTAGGHRRFRPEDIAVFRRESVAAAGTNNVNGNGDKSGGASGGNGSDNGVASLSVASTVASGAANRAKGARRVPAKNTARLDAELAGELFGALVGGRAEEVSALLVNAYLQGRSAAAIFDQLLAPAMKRIGDLWHAGELSIAREHLATRAALAALQTLERSLAAPAAHDARALCCSTEDDFHELPLACAALLLRSEGWQVLSLGANTPFFALAETIRDYRPQLVCVASTILFNPDRAVREYKEVRGAVGRVRASLALGGAGFAEPHVRRRLPADLHADNFQQLRDHAAALLAAGVA